MFTSNKHIQLIDLKCQFDLLKETGFFSTWQWKVDPYLVSGSEKCDIVVCKDLSLNRTIENKKLLLEEPSGFFKRCVHLDEDGTLIFSFIRSKENKTYFRYLVSSDWKEATVVVDETNTCGQFAFDYYGLIFPYVALNFDILTIHGVLLEYEGKGIIISAPSGTGKTTHARLWRDVENAFIINGDKAYCKKVDGKWFGYGLIWSGSSGEQMNRKVKIDALVILERGEVNEAHMESFASLLSSVLPHVLCPKWDEKLVNTSFDLLDDFLSEVPVVRLKCKPDSESVQVLKSCLEMNVWK